MLSVSIYTLGCKLNQVESEALADAFRQAGFSLSAGDETSDAGFAGPGIIIINTCTVTSRSDQKARRVIRKALRDNPRAGVIVTGCYAALDKEKIQALEEPPGHRLFVTAGKAALLTLPAYLARAGADTDETPALISRWFMSNKINAAPEGAFRFTPRQFSFHTRAFLKIQDGCDNHCTYCRIRLARGPSKSMSAREILAELRSLEAAGYWEAVLTGVNVTQYSDGGCEGLGGLLAYLLEGTRTIGIRLSSLDPPGITDELAEVLKHPRIRPHFHLSVQSGSQSVLAKMGRTYSGADVEKAAALLRSAKDNPFIACDIIAGFPGEGAAEFAGTLSLCEKIDFAWIHAFPYSRRPGTPAFSWQQTVSEAEAARRVDILTKLAERGRRNYARLWTGRELEVLVENGGEAAGPAAGDESGTRLPDGYCRGLTRNYLRVLVRYTDRAAPAPGTVLTCNIQAVEKNGYDVYAEI